jgi:hypothetical protein
MFRLYVPLDSNLVPRSLDVLTYVCLPSHDSSRADEQNARLGLFLGSRYRYTVSTVE